MAYFFIPTNRKKPTVGAANLLYYNLRLKRHSNFWGSVQRCQNSTKYNTNDIMIHDIMIRFFYIDTVANVNKISGDDIRPTRIF